MRRAGLACLLLAGACSGATSQPPPSGAPGDCSDGSGPETGCSVPDAVCPVEQPTPGGPCVAPLHCEFQTGTGDAATIFAYTCSAGAWDVDTRCATGGYSYEPLCDLTPPLVESCDTAFMGTLEGALVRIGPPSVREPFRPFEDGEQVDPVTGGQGASMVEFRLQVGCVDAPDCVLIRTTATRDTGGPEPTLSRVQLHCGESLSIFAVLPTACVYSTSWVDVDLLVEVTGVGTAAATVQIPAGTGCGN